MAAVKLLVLVGSAVDDFHADLSRVYATGFLDAFADEPEYELSVAFVSPDGQWCFPSGVEPVDIDAAPRRPIADALAQIVEDGIDVVVPQMFCRPGMTTYRAAFELVGIPYLGNTPEVMAMTADKNIARAVVAAAGVAVPPGRIVTQADRARLNQARFDQAQLDFPVVVKPVDSDNSMGVTVVRDSASFGAAVTDASRYSSAVLVEKYIELGREVRCGIVVVNGELVCLPLEEYAVDEDTNPIRGRADKLDRTDDGDMYLVAKDRSRAWIVDTSDPITDKVWAAARSCYTALGCRHYGLFDFRIDSHGNPWFLEAGLYCSYSPSSVVSVMAAAAGMSVQELFSTTLRELETERHA